MLEIKNYLPLSIESFLKVDVNYIKNYKKNDAIMTRININDVIDNSTLITLNEIAGTKFDHCILFVTQPSFTLNIHKDSGLFRQGNERLNVWAINFIINSSLHEMVWYEQLSEPIKILNKIGSFYYHYDNTNTKEIERHTIVRPTLVRTDIPHNIINYDNNSVRYCISIRSTTSKLTWQEAYLRFSNLN